MWRTGPDALCLKSHCQLPPVLPPPSLFQALGQWSAQRQCERTKKGGQNAPLTKSLEQASLCPGTITYHFDPLSIRSMCPIHAHLLCLTCLLIVTILACLHITLLDTGIGQPGLVTLRHPQFTSIQQYGYYIGLFEPLLSWLLLQILISLPSTALAFLSLHNM